MSKQIQLKNGDERVYPNPFFPVGAIYMSVTSTNPSVYFGGTWVRWGQGRVVVSLNEGDGDFNSSEKTGGNKSHAHTLGAAAAMIGSDQGQANTLAFCAKNLGDMGGTAYTVTGGNTTPSYQRSHNTALTGQTDDNANTTIQPYITCYMWKRTA